MFLFCTHVHYYWFSGVMLSACVRYVHKETISFNVAFINAHVVSTFQRLLVKLMDTVGFVSL